MGAAMTDDRRLRWATNALIVASILWVITLTQAIALAVALEGP